MEPRNADLLHNPEFSLWTQGEDRCSHRRLSLKTVCTRLLPSGDLNESRKKPLEHRFAARSDPPSPSQWWANVLGFNQRREITPSPPPITHFLSTLAEMMKSARAAANRTLGTGSSASSWMSIWRQVCSEVAGMAGGGLHFSGALLPLLLLLPPLLFEEELCALT